MKIHEIKVFSKPRKRKEILLKMKLTLILIFAGLLQVSAVSYSQATKLSFEIEGKQVAEVLREIEEISDFRFFYQREQVDVERRVNLKVENKTIKEIIDLLFPGSEIEHKIFADKLILLAPNELFNEENSALKAEIPRQPRTVTGTVTDQQNQTLVGVTVLIKGTNKGTITDADGKYSLSGVPDDAVLVFSFVGMLTTEIVLGNQTEINIQMEVDDIGIEEVVAVGYGTRMKEELTGSISTLSS